MFSSAGYFQKSLCPYFESGYCERPYCHFAHQIALREAPLYTSSGVPESSTKTNYLTLTATENAQLNKNIPAYTTGGSALGACKVSDPANQLSTKVYSSKTPAYCPTPKGEITTKAENGYIRTATLPMASYEHKPFPTGPSTLVYKPTPIAELQLRKSKEPHHIVTTPCIAEETAIVDDKPSPIVQNERGTCSSKESVIISSEICPMNDASDKEEPCNGDDVVSAGGDDLANAQAYDPRVSRSKSVSNDIRVTVTDHPELFHDNSLEAFDESDQAASTGAASYRNMTMGSGRVSEDKAVKDKAVREVSEVKAVRDRVSEVKAVREVFVNLFGEDSSDEDELLPLSQALSSSESEKVMSTASLKTDFEVIDITEDDTCKAPDMNHTVAESASGGKCGSQHPGRAEAPLQLLAGATDLDQCKELFQQFQKSETKSRPAKLDRKKEAESNEEHTSGVHKKRVAREFSADTPMPKRMAVSGGRKPVLPSPAEVMYRRLEAVRSAISDDGSRQSSLSCSTNNKYQPEGVTVAQSNKNSDRKAHVPISDKVKKVLQRPRILPLSNCKVPTNVRQAYLDKIVDECLKVYPKEADAFKRAEAEEAEAYRRSNNKKVYLNVAVNAVKRLRGEQKQRGAEVVSAGQVSHETVLSGKAAGHITVGLKRKGSVPSTIDDMTGQLLFKKLAGYLLTEQELVDNAFPRPQPNKSGYANIKWSNYDKVPNNKGNERRCLRCGKSFRVTSDGGYSIQEDCIHHWGKPWKKKVNGTWDTRYTCCDERSGTDGCCIASGHVHDTNKYADLSGFVTTLAKPNNQDYCGVFALDCEMIYTTAGLELARVTVIDDKLQIVYDSIVQPSQEVIDYNTRFSGLKAEDFECVEVSLKDVQAILLDMFQEDTILIGHSLNSDLVALKLIHSSVVDTSVMFPHKNGPPFKRALRNLMSEILSKIIQEDGSEGHNSSEDAKACMELVKWQVLQDVKKDFR